MCDVTWEDGCGDEPPPDGFSPESVVSDFCAHACAASQLPMITPSEQQPATAAPTETASAKKPLVDAAVEKNWTRGYVESATSNVILACAKRPLPLADSPELAAQDPLCAYAGCSSLIEPRSALAQTCTWDDYESFLAVSGLDWTDDPVTKRMIAESSPKELTLYITTAVSIAEMLRHSLGDEAFSVRTEPVTIDVIGWAFTWVPRPEEDEETSMTEMVHEWTAELNAATRLVWGAQIGDTLRRLLPLVKSVTVRGYGPEAPQVDLTPLRDDGWLSLELHHGLYTQPSEPAPTITLLENSGLHDGGFWPSDADCISDKGCLCTTDGCITNRSLPVVEQRQFIGEHGSGIWSPSGVPLRCA
eukprot:7378218-Prymnesium_polylepis.2